MENRFVSLKVREKVGMIMNINVSQPLIKVMVRLLSSDRRAINPLNDDLVRLSLYASFALGDPNSDYHKLSNLPQCLILQTNIAYT